MTLPATCFEIVHFAFQDTVPLTRQVACMTSLGDWVSGQPGFVARQSYHDRQSNRWTDIVEWRSAGEAQAAMARSQTEPALAGVMALIAPEPFLVGHCERLL